MKIWIMYICYSKIIWFLIFAGQYRNDLVWFWFQFFFYHKIKIKTLGPYKELKFWFLSIFQNAIVSKTKNAPSEIIWFHCALATAEQGKTVLTYFMGNWNVMRFKNFVKNINIWVLILFIKIKMIQLREY